MSPPMPKRSIHDHTHPTMSPTQSTISGVFTCTCRRHDSTVDSNLLSAFITIFRTVHFWKYHIPISLLKLQPIYDTVWWKKSGFDQLVSTIYGLLKLHPITDIIPLIAREFPIKKFIAQQEAAKVVHRV